MELEQTKETECTKKSTIKDNRTEKQREYIEKVKKRTIGNRTFHDNTNRPSSAKCEQYKLEQQIVKVPNHLRFVVEDMYPKETRMEV
jgi:hypothetical protein